MYKYFATRTAIQNPATQADAEGQGQELGPFDVAYKARAVLAVYLASQVALGLGERATAAQRIFVHEHLGILTEMAAYGEATQFEAHGARWTIRGRETQG